MTALTHTDLPRYRIVTPEHVVFHYQVAGLPRRAMAWMLDTTILWTVKIAAYIALAVSIGMFGVALGFVISFLLDFGYHCYFELYQAGQSPGKKLMGLRVVPASGARLTVVDSLMRNLLRPIDTLPIAMTLGGCVALADRYHRRLGDLAAGTLVVRQPKLAIPNALLSTNRDNSFRSDASLRARVLAKATREERDLMLELMLRRDELEHARREAVFRDAATYFRKRYNLPDQLEHLSDEQTVLNLALLIQDAGPTPKKTRENQ